MHYQVKRD